MTSLPVAGLASVPRRTLHSAVAGLGIHRPSRARIEGAFVTVEPEGVSQRVKGEHGVTTSWLAQGAARAAIAASGVDPVQIQLVVVGTTSPDVLWPSTACLVQSELGLPMVASFDLYAGEAGLLTALAVADRFVGSGTKAALVIGADAERQLVNLPGQRAPGLKAAASAVVLTGSARDEGILATAAGGAPGAGAEAPSRGEAVDAAVEGCLQRAGLDRKQVDLILGQEARDFQDPLIALYDAVELGRVRPGTVVLLVSRASGGAWAASCLRWGSTPIAEW